MTPLGAPSDRLVSPDDARRNGTMDELNGRILGLQILLTGVIARLAGEERDPVGFLTSFRDEIRAVTNGIRITGATDERVVRMTALHAIDELFSLMKPPSQD
jgi:hypothetical protein